MARPKGIIRKLVKARAKVNKTIADSVDRGNRFSGALSGEGYNGGYRAALDDVLQALNGVQPRSSFWENGDEDSKE
jgi:hypothetical protein